MAFLNKDEAYDKQAKMIMEAALANKIQLVTSTFTQAELFYIKDNSTSTVQKTEEKQEEIISTLFDSPWLILASYEREEALLSRQLSREYKISAMDSIHIATAIRVDAKYFHTTDQKTILNKLPSPLSLPPRYTEGLILQLPGLHGETIPLI